MKLVLLLLLLLDAGAQLLGPVEVSFSPNIHISSYYSLDSSVSWRIQGSYTSLAPPAYDGDIIIHIPVLYFPSPGIARLDAGSHPCIVSPNPCCLLDFADQYTSVAFYRFLSSQSSWLNRTSCSSIKDIRPFIWHLYNSGAAGSMFTEALDGIGTGCTVSVQSSPAGTEEEVTVTIPHLAMKTFLSEKDAFTESKLFTFVGVMWLRTRPVSSFTYGFEVFVSQPAVTLTLFGPFLTLSSAGSYAANCSMTPQGICIFCSNPITPDAYYIFTEEGAKTSACEFRCNSGHVYHPGDHPPDTASCKLCTDPACPDGQHPTACTPFSDASCEYCTNTSSCSEIGNYMEYCTGGSTMNPGCRPCTNAPLGGVYTSGCQWYCGQGYYSEVLGECTWNAQDREQLAVTLQVYMSGVYPKEGILPGEILFNESVFARAFSNAMDGVLEKDIFLLSVLRVNATVLGKATSPVGTTLTPKQGSRRRLLLLEDAVDSTVMIQLGGLENFSKVESYFWLPPNSVTDPVQQLIEAVFSGEIQAFVGRELGTQIRVAFVTLPRYEKRGDMITQILSKGGIPQGIGAEDRYPAGGDTPAETPSDVSSRSRTTGVLEAAECASVSTVGYVVSAVVIYLVSACMFS